VTQKNRSKSLVCYSDLHIGSKRSVCSDDPAEESYKPNKFQKTLFEIWNETIDEFHQKPTVKLINGEPFDGPNKKEIGRGQWTTNMAQQSEEAEKLINLIPSENTLFVQGSGYHVDQAGTSFEEMLAKSIKAIKYSTYYEPTYAEDFVQLRIHGKLFNITHHIGFARWAAYRTTALAREMAAMHFMKEQLGNIDVFVRSHVHYFVHVEFTHTHGFTNPAWKYPDKHLFRGGMGGIIPDVGCTEVIVESNGKILIEKHIATIKQKPEVLEF
jgi:hypothetical protein